MVISKSGIQLTEEMINEVEKELEIKYPQDYKEFMLKNNGGEPDGTWAFDFFEYNVPEKTSSIVRYFEKIYLNDTVENDDQKAGYKALVGSNQIPKEYLPIADDPFGNIIFIGVGGTQFGNIIFGNAELEDPETGYLVMSLIATSFTEFYKGLYLVENE